MNKAAYIVSFLCGAVVGAVAMSIYKDRKTEPEAASPMDDDGEDIDTSDIEVITEDEYIERVTNEIAGKDPELVNALNNVLTKLGYQTGDHTNPDAEDGPYIIAPDDFGDFSDYDAMSMTLFSDGVLVDDQMRPVDDIEHCVGLDYMKYFGVYPKEPDTVYIRNDELCCDYEIVRDLRTFKEIDASNPHMKWRDNE